MPDIFIFSEKFKEGFLRLIAPLCKFLSGLGISPDALSLAGLSLSMAAGMIYGHGSFFWGGVILILAGICDVLDGQMARQTGKLPLFGAFFDSTIDRFGELFIFLGFAWYFAGLSAEEPGAVPGPWAVLITILALSGSFMVSYTRARAEGLGIDCKIGWMQRPERIAFLVFGSLLAGVLEGGHFIMIGTLFIIAVLSNYTAVQRIIYVKNQLAGKNQES